MFAKYCILRLNLYCSDATNGGNSVEHPTERVTDMSDDLSGITLDFNQHYADAQPPSTRQQVRRLFELVERLHMSGAIDAVEQWQPITSPNNWKVRKAIALKLPERLKELKRASVFRVTSTRGMAEGVEVASDLYVGTTEALQPLWVLVQYARDLNSIENFDEDLPELELSFCVVLDEEVMVKWFEEGTFGARSPAYEVLVDLINVLDEALDVKTMLTRALSDEIVRLNVDWDIWRSALRAPKE
jgi:hypothetical protein